MKYTVKKENGKAKISFIVPLDEWEAEMEAAYQRTKHEYKQQGFRDGHVPRKVLENKYGRGLFLEEALNNAFPTYYGKVLDEHNDILREERPSVDYESFNEDGFKFSAEVSLKPEVVLGKYKGLKIKKVDTKVTDDEIEAELKKVQEKNCRLVEVEREVKQGDEVTIDYSGSVDGVKFDGGTAEKQTLEIGGGKFIPGFEEQVVGMKKGEERDINVKFPDEYHSEELKGKNAVFAIKLHEIREKQYSAIDDEFAKDYSEFDSLAEYKADICKHLTEDKEKKAKNEEENNLLDAILKDSKMDVPASMVENEIDACVEDFGYSLQNQGLNIKDYLKYTNTTIDDLRKMYKEKAQKTVSLRLVLEAIVKAEKIEVSSKEVDAKIKEMAKQAGKTIKEFNETVGNQYRGYIENQILVDKLMEFLRNQNNFVA